MLTLYSYPTLFGVADTLYGLTQPTMNLQRYNVGPDTGAILLPMMHRFEVQPTIRPYIDSHGAEP